MISKLRGLVWDLSPPILCLDVNGIGYELQLPVNAFVELEAYAKNAVKNPIELWVHHQFKEDGQALYGFLSLEEKNLFRAIIKVNGIGPKIALAILSYYTPSAFLEILSRQDVLTFSKVPGIGKKTAERLIVELKGLLKNAPMLGLGGVGTGQLGTKSHATLGSGLGSRVQQDAVAGLLGLGYKVNEAETAIAQVMANLRASDSNTDLDHLDIDQLIRQALKSLAKV
ncbi:MAG: Holliday junction branch migration protein RuvA [Gammaproteobacteria bacterium]